jgi:hypothetical protein
VKVTSALVTTRVDVNSALPAISSFS